MGVASGCSDISTRICSFLQQHPYFLFIFLMFFVLYIYIVRDKSVIKLHTHSIIIIHKAGVAWE